MLLSYGSGFAEPRRFRVLETTAFLVLNAATEMSKSGTGTGLLVVLYKRMNVVIFQPVASVKEGQFYQKR